MRFVHLTVVAALIVAAVYVYTVKFESTVRAAEVTRLAAEIKRERDAIAALRAEWAELNDPARIQRLTERHLALRMLDPAQIDHFDHLPQRPPPPGSGPDAIAAMIDAWQSEQPDGAGPSPPAGPAVGGGREEAAAGGRAEHP
ncbi:MAG: hypothetical protein J2P53_01730 [Bradyrhizobiaceae bacterium]|nr:hypothetical protein [Bradyrhizobiaceae bacterium]